jgi:hypothetical protein
MVLSYNYQRWDACQRLEALEDAYYRKTGGKI